MGELLHIFHLVAFHSVLWMCPQLEQMLGSVQSRGAVASSWCTEIRQNATSKFLKHSALQKAFVACSRWFPLNCLAATPLVFITADLFLDQLRLVSGNRIANTTKITLRRK